MRLGWVGLIPCQLKIAEGVAMSCNEEVASRVPTENLNSVLQCQQEVGEGRFLFHDHGYSTAAPTRERAESFKRFVADSGVKAKSIMTDLRPRGSRVSHIAEQVEGRVVFEEVHGGRARARIVVEDQFVRASGLSHGYD